MKKSKPNDWTVVKKTGIKKHEKFINNFWEIPGEEYLNPSINITYSNPYTSTETLQVKPIQLVPGDRHFPQLSDLKRKLMEEKSKLDVYNVISWSKHTNFTYIYSELTKVLRKDYNIELCTTAWTKMWEILDQFLEPNLLEGKVRALFLCEGPGSFVTCTNQYLTTRFGPKFVFDWEAITLADQDNNLFDRYFPRWAPNNWFFGPDGTGDLMNPNTIINGVWPRYNSEANKCDFITADGSVNCQHDPNNQELIVCPLKMAEIVAALKCLKINGMFVIKYFTIFEPQTVCQLWLLACLFQKISIIKPVTSKPGNSEIYLVCQGYHGISDELIEQLVHCSPTTLLFDPNIIPSSFTNFLNESMMSIVNRQIKIINQNISWFQNKYKMNADKMYAAKDFALREYIKKYQIKKIKINSQFV